MDKFTADDFARHLDHKQDFTLLTPSRLEPVDALRAAATAEGVAFSTADKYMGRDFKGVVAQEVTTPGCNTLERLRATYPDAYLVALIQYPG